MGLFERAARFLTGDDQAQYPRVGSLRRSALFPQLIVLEIKYCFILSAVAVVVLAVSERFLGPSTFLAGILFGLIVVAVVVTAIRYTDAVEARIRE